MFRGLGKLTWLEIKIFLREPLGAIGSIVLPVAMFLLVGRWWSGMRSPGLAATGAVLRVELPVFVAVLIPLTGVLSLVTIISIYREGGILRRLRATPLRPQTILTAHVLAKLALTLLTLGLLVLAGKRPPRASRSRSERRFCIRCWGCAGCLCRCARCPRRCTRWRGQFLSPTPSRCWRGSGRASRGGRTWAMSPRWRPYSLCARPFPPRCFAGSSARPADRRRP